MASFIDSLLHHLLPSLTLLYLFAAPFTKVEESFNIQAAYDILTYGLPTSGISEHVTRYYDHVDFPGSVPRTFVGALTLAGIATPFTRFLRSPVQQQILVRAILGLYNAFSLLAFSDAISTVFGPPTRNWYILLQASQFHVIFYASRTLPNMFAFGLTTLALRTYLIASQSALHGKVAARQAAFSVGIMTFAGVVFRSEIAILLAVHAVYLLATKRTPVLGAILMAGSIGAVTGLAVTVGIDSIFWRQFPLWPEWSGFYYNTILGKSSDWGVSPWHYYFTNVIPRLLLNPFSLVCIALVMLVPPARRRTAPLLLPNIIFIALYSALPHKEWRFIIYSVPALTAAAAVGANWIWTRRFKSALYSLLSVALVASLIGAFVLSALSLAISSLNYPGGEALTRLHAFAAQEGVTGGSSGVVKVHLSNLACQTGVTRFLQLHDAAGGADGEVVGGPVWEYNKTEDGVHLRDPAFWAQFDFALAEGPAQVIGSWEKVDVVYGFGGVRVLRPGELNSDEEGKIPVHLASGRNVLAKPVPDGGYGAAWYKWIRRAEDVLRPHTRGWWVDVMVVEKLWILRQQKRRR